jgi:hypothetical protein
LPEGEQTSKHGEEVGTMQFRVQGEEIKKEKKKNEYKEKREIKKNMYEIKKNMSYKNKIK